MSVGVSVGVRHEISGRKGGEPGAAGAVEGRNEVRDPSSKSRRAEEQKGLCLGARSSQVVEEVEKALTGQQPGTRQRSGRKET